MPLPAKGPSTARITPRKAEPERQHAHRPEPLAVEDAVQKGDQGRVGVEEDDRQRGVETAVGDEHGHGRQAEEDPGHPGEKGIVAPDVHRLAAQ